MMTKAAMPPIMPPAMAPPEDPPPLFGIGTAGGCAGGVADGGGGLVGEPAKEIPFTFSPTRVHSYLRFNVSGSWTHVYLLLHPLKEGLRSLLLQSQCLECEALNCHCTKGMMPLTDTTVYSTTEAISDSRVKDSLPIILAGENVSPFLLSALARSPFCTALEMAV